MDRYGQSYSSDSDEHSPVMWLRGHPIYAAYFIVLIFSLSMVVTALLNLMNSGAPIFNALIFTPHQVLQGQVWRIFTYGFFNPPSIQFALDMLMFVWFGREVERTFGRKKFLWFYATLYLLTPLLLTAVGRWLPAQLFGETGSFAIFVAFATIYPAALLMFNLLAKWVAIVLFAVYSLMYLSDHSWVNLLSLWSTCGFAYAFVRHHQGYLDLPDFKFWKRKPKLRVLPDLPAKTAKKTSPATAARGADAGSAAEVDALLDKIAQSGYASLTAKERATLESRSQSLKKNAARD